MKQLAVDNILPFLTTTNITGVALIQSLLNNIVLSRVVAKNRRFINKTDTRSLTIISKQGCMCKEYVYELDSNGNIVQPPNHKGMVVSQNIFALLLTDEYFDLEGYRDFCFDFRFEDTGFDEDIKAEIWEKLYFRQLMLKLNGLKWTS